MTTRILLGVFVLFIIYGTTLPFRFTTDPQTVASHLHRVSLNPLESPDTGARISLPDAAQNVLLFVPFGLLAMLALGEQPRHRFARVLVVTALGAALSVCIEIAQLFSLDRITSVSDVMTNTIGAGLGAIAEQRSRDAFSRVVTRASAEGYLDARIYPVIVLLVVVLLAALQPFDVTLDVSTIFGKVHQLTADLWQSSTLRDQGAEFVQFTLLAFFVSRSLAARDASHIVLQTTAGCALIACALEGAQLLITSRMPGLEHALVKAGGAVSGAWLWRADHLRGRTAVWAPSLVIGTALAAAMQQLGPFQFSLAPVPLRWAPIMSDHERTSLGALSHVTELMLTYFPMAFVLANAWTGRRALRASLLITLAIATPIEITQSWVGGRLPNLTDMAISVAGAYLGVLAATRGAAAFERTVLATYSAR